MSKLLSFILLVAALAIYGCGKTLEPGGAYAPPNVKPDMTFYVIDAGFDLAYSTVDAAFKFEKDNRLMLWQLSKNIKTTLDKVRPEALMIRNEYAKARTAYEANPTPDGLTGLQVVLKKMQQLAATANALLPK